MLASYNFGYKNETPTKWAGDHEKLLYRRVKKCLYQLTNRREKIGQWVSTARDDQATFVSFFFCFTALQMLVVALATFALCAL